MKQKDINPLSFFQERRVYLDMIERKNPVLPTEDSNIWGPSIHSYEVNTHKT
jgi:hypothetical protein